MRCASTTLYGPSHVWLNFPRGWAWLTLFFLRHSLLLEMLCFLLVDCSISPLPSYRHLGLCSRVRVALPRGPSFPSSLRYFPAPCSIPCVMTLSLFMLVALLQLRKLGRMVSLSCWFVVWFDMTTEPLVVHLPSCLLLCPAVF